MRRTTTTTVMALVAALSLAACSADTAEDAASEATDAVTDVTDESTESADAAADDATETSEDAAAGTMSDPVCVEFFEGQGQPLAERAGTTRDLLESGAALDAISFSEVSLLQSRLQMLGEEASADQAALLERVNAPFTEVVDAVVAEDNRLAEEIEIPTVDVADSAAAQDELETSCS